MLQLSELLLYNPELITTQDYSRGQKKSIDLQSFQTCNIQRVILYFSYKYREQ